MYHKALKIHFTDTDPPTIKEFLLSYEYGQDVENHIKKFQSDCMMWGYWVKENKHKLKNQREYAEKYWVDKLGYELTWAGFYHDFAIYI